MNRLLSGCCLFKKKADLLCLQILLLVVFGPPVGVLPLPRSVGGGGGVAAVPAPLAPPQVSVGGAARLELELEEVAQVLLLASRPEG